MKIDEDHTSAEMERLRVRRLWRAFAGGTDPSGPRSMLGRGLVASVVLAVLVLAAMFVAGVIEATTASSVDGGSETVAAATTTVAPTPSTQPEPAPTPTTQTEPAPTATTEPPPPPTTNPPPAEQVGVAVSSTVFWTDTGVDVSVGEVIQVEATGTVAAAVGDPRTYVGPDGSADPEFLGANRTENGVQVDGGHAALIGMIGENGKPFLIGASNTIDVDTDGRLLLGVNDGGLDNNDGQFDVTLTILPAASS